MNPLDDSWGREPNAAAKFGKRDAGVGLELRQDGAVDIVDVGCRFHDVFLWG